MAPCFCSAVSSSSVLKLGCDELCGCMCAQAKHRDRSYPQTVRLSQGLLHGEVRGWGRQEREGGVLGLGELHVWLSLLVAQQPGPVLAAGGSHN